MKFEYRIRYNLTDNFDKFERWARLCYCENQLISWINKIKYNDNIIYEIKDFFPSLSNDLPCYTGVELDFEEAKKNIEKRFTDFIKNFLKND